MGKKAIKNPNLDNSGIMSVEPAKMIKVSPQVSFDFWFQKKVKSGLLKPWQEKTVLIFFRKRGIGDTETWDTYEKMFEKF